MRLTEAGLCLQGPAWTMAKTASRLCKAAMLKRVLQLAVAMCLTLDLRQNQLSCKAAMLKGVQQLEVAMSSTDEVRQHQVSRKAAVMKGVQQLEVVMSSTNHIRGEKLPSHVQEAAAGHLQEPTGTAGQPGNTDASCDTSYRAHKHRGGSAAYMRQWCTLQSCDVFLQWIKKPQHLEHFTLPSHDITSTT